MKIGLIAALTSVALTSLLASACVSPAPTKASIARQQRFLDCGNPASVRSTRNGEGLCSLSELEASNERTKMENRINTGVPGGS